MLINLDGTRDRLTNLETKFNDSKTTVIERYAILQAIEQEGHELIDFVNSNSKLYRQAMLEQIHRWSEKK